LSKVSQQGKDFPEFPLYILNGFITKGDGIKNAFFAAALASGALSSRAFFMFKCEEACVKLGRK
jgi:hypothetical protein